MLRMAIEISDVLLKTLGISTAAGAVALLGDKELGSDSKVATSVTKSGCATVISSCKSGGSWVVGLPVCMSRENFCVLSDILWARCSNGQGGW